MIHQIIGFSIIAGVFINFVVKDIIRQNEYSSKIHIIRMVIALIGFLILFY